MKKIMRHYGMQYLNKEIRKEIRELDRLLKEKAIEPIVHAYKMDSFRWMKARIEVAKLIDKEHSHDQR